MGNSRYIGRIGALAVMLGVGAAVAIPGVAWAEDGEGASPGAGGSTSKESSSTDSDPSSDAGAGAGAEDSPVAPSGGSQTSPGGGQQQSPAEGIEDDSSRSSGVTVDLGGGVVVSSSGGSLPDPDEDDEAEVVPPAGDEVVAEPSGGGSSYKQPESQQGSDSHVAVPNAVHIPTIETLSATTIESPESSTPPSATQPPAEQSVPLVEADELVVQPIWEPTAETSDPAPEPTTVLTTLLSPSVTGDPGAPVETPLVWALLAAARREVGSDEPPATAVEPGATGNVETSEVETTESESTALTVEQQAAFIVDQVDAPPPSEPGPSSTVGVMNSLATSITPSSTAAIDPNVAAVVKVGVYFPEVVAASPDGRYVYAGGGTENQASGAVIVIDTKTNTVKKTIATNFVVTGIAVAPNGVVYAAGFRVVAQGSAVGVVGVISSTHTLSKTITLGAYTSYSMPIVVTPDGKSAVVGWATLAPWGYSGALTTISTATQRVTRTLLFQGSVADLAVTPDSTTAVVAVADSYPPSLIKVDLATGAANFIDLGHIASNVRSVALSPGGTFAYVAFGGSSRDIAIVHLSSGDVLDTFNAGQASSAEQIRLSADGRTLFALDGSAMSTVDILSRTTVDTLSVGPGGPHYYLADIAVASNGRVYLSTLYDNSVAVVGLYPANSAPIVSVTVGDPNSSTGVVKGSITASDLNGNPLTFSATVPGKGTITLTASGTFTYTPTAAARHAASATIPGNAHKTDSFTVTVSNAAGGTATVQVTVQIAPKNAAPTRRVSVISPKEPWKFAAGVVTGKVTATDADKDSVTFTASGPSKGSVSIGSDGSFTYTPTAAALERAAATNATTADKQDSFVVTVDDGHGGQVSVSVKVMIKPGKAPSTTAGLRDMIATAADHSPDYIYIQQVHGSDNQDRLIAYIGGTDLPNFLSVLSNLPAYAGIPKPNQVAAIAGAILASGNPLIPVMLVGYSQGGMDAQNLAASGLFTLNIKAVVTMAAPIIQAAPGLFKTYDIVHLENKADPVPALSKPLERATNVLANNIFSSTSRNDRKVTLTDPLYAHAQQLTYVDVANAFDRNPGFKEAKDAIRKFQGIIISQGSIG